MGGAGTSGHHAWDLSCGLKFEFCRVGGARWDKGILHEAFVQMASNQLRSHVERRRGLGNGTLEATVVSDAEAASRRHAERRRSRRGNLRRSSPHSSRLGCNLWSDRHDGRYAETRPPGRPGASATRFGNERPVAPCRQLQGGGVVQPISQWWGHSPATPSGKGRHQIRRQEPLGPGTKSLAGLKWNAAVTARPRARRFRVAVPGGRAWRCAAR